MEEKQVDLNWQRLLSLLSSLDDKHSMAQLFNFLLTYDEREMLAKRLALTEALLQKEKSQRQIAQDLQMSIASITRGSNELKRTDIKSIEFLKHLLNIK